MIIGISGPSTSGKSTIADFLKQNLDAEVFYLDEYFAMLSLPRSEMYGQEIGDWDKPESIDWELFMNDLNACNSSLVIIEGFILFGNQSMHSRIDALINIEFEESDFPIALQRRIQRGFHEEVPEDWEQNPTGNKVNFSCAYFKNIAWKRAFEHPEYRKPVDWNRPTLTLSATADINDNCKRALEFARDLIRPQKCSVQ